MSWVERDSSATPPVTVCIEVELKGEHPKQRYNLQKTVSSGWAVVRGVTWGSSGKGDSLPLPSSEDQVMANQSIAEKTEKPIQGTERDGTKRAVALVATFGLRKARMKDIPTVVLVVLVAIAVSSAVNYPPGWDGSASRMGGRGKGKPCRLPATKCCMCNIASAKVWWTSPITGRTKHSTAFGSRAPSRGGRPTAQDGRVINAVMRHGRGVSWETCPWIRMGNLYMMWSNSAPGTSTVFFHSNMTHVAVLNDAQFETFDSARGASRRRPAKNEAPYRTTSIQS